MKYSAKEKVALALERVCGKSPFFAPFLLTSQVEECSPELRDQIMTFATDGRTIWYNPDFVDHLKPIEVCGILVHEALHKMFKHHLRIQNREPQRWNKAADYVIDPIVKDVGFPIPTGKIPHTFKVFGKEITVDMDLSMHGDSQYDGKSTEQVYELLPEPPKDKGGKGGQPGSGQPQNGQPQNGDTIQQSIGDVIKQKNADGTEMSEAEVREAEADMDRITITAANAAKAVGKFPGSLESYITQLVEPKVDWQSALRRFFGGDHPDDFSTRRINRPQWHMRRMLEPTIEKSGVGCLVIGVDTSGSVSDKELVQFFSEINFISEEMSPRQIIVIQCDHSVQKVDEYDQGEIVDDFRVKGRGGTRVMPVFREIDKRDYHPDRMIYLTDMGVDDWPKTPPPYPLLWVSTAPTSVKAPVGETITISV